MNPYELLSQDAPAKPPDPKTASVLLWRLQHHLPKARRAEPEDDTLIWDAGPPTVQIQAVPHHQSFRLVVRTRVGRLHEIDSVDRMFRLWGAGTDATATLQVNPENGVVHAVLALNPMTGGWAHEGRLLQVATLVKLLAVRVREARRAAQSAGLLCTDPDVQLGGWPDTEAENAKHSAAVTGMLFWSHVTLTGTSKLGPWFSGKQQDDHLRELLNRGWKKHTRRTATGVTLIAPAGEPDIARVELAWADHSPTYGPMLRILAWPRTVQPATTGTLLRLQGEGVSPVRFGNWTPSSDVPAMNVPGEPVPEGMVFAVHLPAALAHAGLLNDAWGWAEAAASAASRRTTN